MSFKVIVAGSRDFTNLDLLTEKLDSLLANKDDIVIVSGMARGADKLGVKYASIRGLEVINMPADWQLHGKSAGYKRNVEMANEADALIAFWDGVSKGTGHMIQIAKKKGLKVRVVRIEGPQLDLF